MSAGARVHNVAVSFAFGIGGGTASQQAKDVFAGSGAEARDSTVAAIFGLEGEYRFRQVSLKYTPFVGGMLGYGVVTNGGDIDDRHSASINHGGLHLRAAGGVDLVSTPWFGVGIVAELGLTSFGNPELSTSTEDDVTTFEDESYTESEKLDIGGGTAMYGGLAIRAVFFP